MFAEDGKYYRIKHLIPIVPVYLIIFTVSIAFTFYYAFDGDESWIKYLTVPIFYYSALMVVVCHLYAMFSNPGQVEKNKHADGLNPHNTQTSNSLFCLKCMTSRP